jgi:N-acetylglucosaminyldiphosphoundecaprenol N-acetyl-beta-D-mannosaminyltransferase
MNTVCSNSQGAESLVHAPRQKAALFGIEIDSISMDQAVEIVSSWLLSKQTSCRYVVTPNMDHVVQLQSNCKLLEAYSDASLIVADGWPLVAATHLLGIPIPERVTGSDLVPRLFGAAQGLGELRVYLLGALPGVADRAVEKIRHRWPCVTVVGTHSPPLGFENDPEYCEHIVQSISDAQPQLLIVGLGAPKQELWLHQYRSRLNARVAIAAGATIDFLAGEQTRAPRWVQRLYMEWFYRILTDPKRLVARYARGAWIFPQLVCKEWWQHTVRRDPAVSEMPSPHVQLEKGATLDSTVSKLSDSSDIRVDGKEAPSDRSSSEGEQTECQVEQFERVDR